MSLRHLSFVFAACACIVPSIVWAQPEEEPEFPDFAETVEGWDHHAGFLHLYRDPDRAAPLRRPHVTA